MELRYLHVVEGRKIKCWLKRQRSSKQTDLPSEFSIPDSVIKQSIKCYFHAKTILLGALSAEGTVFL